MNPGRAIDAPQLRGVLPQAEAPPAAPARLGDAVRDFERRQVEAALAA